jgi:hypothetical protein
MYERLLAKYKVVIEKQTEDQTGASGPAGGSK